MDSDLPYTDNLTPEIARVWREGTPEERYRLTNPGHRLRTWSRTFRHDSPTREADAAALMERLPYAQRVDHPGGAITVRHPVLLGNKTTGTWNRRTIRP